MAKSVALPTNVRPIKYALTLTPDFGTFTFEGQESIDISILEPTSKIVLNCAEINIQNATLSLPNSTEIKSTKIIFDKDNETVTLQFQSELPIGISVLILCFTGELNNKLRGFYRSNYKDRNGRECYLATTQFEATDARRAFPCWDEPALKAIFQLTLLIPPNLVAVSNMPLVSENIEHLTGLSKKVFAETPEMSTYLLAFIIGDLKSIEQCATDGTIVRVWTTAGLEQNGRFALEVSVKLLDYFNNYFGIVFPLPKLDHIAIPDFAAGAMENWGAITYRETALLVDTDNTSARTRQMVAIIVAHEMAHMWFGDLVTMSWWNDLWLNESFASWVGYKAVDHLFPEWEMWTQFLSSDTNEALALDGLKNSHPIEQKVGHPSEIGQLFDPISYSKGGSILRMLEHFLGPETFRQGLNFYLKRHQYGNASTQDLWDSLGECSNQPVSEIMDTWTTQTGYPMIDVQTTQTNGKLKLVISQNRFSYDHLTDPKSCDKTLWQIPLDAKTSTGSVSTLMSKKKTNLSLSIPQNSPGKDWFKVNSNQTGFYRVNYSPADWAKLHPAIQGMMIPATDRLVIQNDAYALSRSGYISPTQFLSLANSYIGETNATVWADLALNLASLDSLLAYESYHSEFQKSARDIFEKVGQRVGWDALPGEGHLDSLLRSTVLTELGRYEDEKTLAEASNRFLLFTEDQRAVHPDIRTVVFALTAKRGDRSTYDKMWELQEQANLEEEKVRLLRALVRFEHPELLRETLERALSPDVRTHNTISIVVGVALNHQGRNLAWEFLKTNWEEFNRRYGEGGFGLMRLLGITESFTTREKLNDIEAFFEMNPVPAGDRKILQSIEEVKINIAWLDYNRQVLVNHFSN